MGAPADGVVVDGRVQLFFGASPGGAVVAGCDPVLGIAEGLLERAGGERVVGVPTRAGADDPRRRHRRLVEEHLLDARRYRTSVGIPSLSMGEPSYTPHFDRWRNWRGPS